MTLRVRHGRRAILCFLAVAGLVALAGCRSEAEQRAHHIRGLRQDAAGAVAELEQYCEARAQALDGFQQDASGWDRALAEVLRAPDAVNDYCIEGGTHEHESEGDAPPPAGRPPRDTTRNSV